MNASQLYEVMYEVMNDEICRIVVCQMLIYLLLVVELSWREKRINVA